MFFFPLIFCEEPTSGCVILSPHYSASSTTVFQPSVYSLLSQLSGLQVYHFSTWQLFCDREGARCRKLDPRGSVRCVLCRTLLRTGRESIGQPVPVLQVGFLPSFGSFHASRILLETCACFWLWDSRSHIKALLLSLFFF